MRGKIFVLANKKDIEKRNFGLPWTMSMTCTKLGINSITEELPEETRESVEQLERIYKIKCKPEKIGEYAAYKLPLNDFAKSLEWREIKKRGEKISNLVNLINKIDRTHFRFFFAYNHLINNPIELLDDLKSNRNVPEYIVQSYDCQM